MGKKSSPPPPPDYTGLAEKTAESSKASQVRADFANRPAIQTPWGTQTWDTYDATDPATGERVTRWIQYNKLEPMQQAALDAQMALDANKSGLAHSFMNRVRDDYSQPFDMSNMPERAGSPQVGLPSMGGDISSGVGDASRQRVERAMLERLRPEQQFQTEALETKLANQGLSPGSKAYDRAMQSQADQFSRDQFNALMMGGQEQRNQFDMARSAGDYANQQNQQQFGQNLQAGNFQNQNRQQAIAEQAMRRGMSLNEMNALLTGTQVSMPNMPSFNTSAPAGAVNYSNAGQQQYNAAMNNYNAQQQQQQGLFGGLGGLASLGLGAYGLGMFG